MEVKQLGAQDGETLCGREGEADEGRGSRVEGR